VTAVGNRLIGPHEGVFLPNHHVSHANCHNQLAPWTAVLFDRPGLANGLNNPGVASFCFPATKTGFEALNVLRKVIVVWFAAVTARH
jgi:hypothetical protein